jgi:hypothetical protein
MRFIMVCLLTLSLQACADSRPPSVPGLEDAESLGHGFWLIVVAEETPGGAEAVGHFGYCYYKSQNLGQCDRLSPSPSGKFAIYQQANTGFVLFFDTRTGKSTPITSSGLLGEASWQEQAQVVQFNAGESGSKKSFTFNFSSAVGGT